jgi:hypothetical protein
MAVSSFGHLQGGLYNARERKKFRVGILAIWPSQVLIRDHILSSLTCLKSLCRNSGRPRNLCGGGLEAIGEETFSNFKTSFPLSNFGSDQVSYQSHPCVCTVCQVLSDDLRSTNETERARRLERRLERIWLSHCTATGRAELIYLSSSSSSSSNDISTGDSLLAHGLRLLCSMELCSQSNHLSQHQTQVH